MSILRIFRRAYRVVNQGWDNSAGFVSVFDTLQVVSTTFLRGSPSVIDYGPTCWTFFGQNQRGQIKQFAPQLMFGMACLLWFRYLRFFHGSHYHTFL